MAPIRPGSIAPTAQSTTTTATGTHPGPMDLSASKRHLTDEERATRIREGRCLYCGGLSHLARECPNKSSRRTTIVVGTTSTIPTIIELHSEN